ncbi:MAG: MFS transporter [Thalassolituus sp.]
MSHFLHLTQAEQTNNIWRLTLAQALAGANSVMIFATGAVIGNQLAPSPALATLPVSLFVVGMALCILPAGLVAQRFGRLTAFQTGTTLGVLSGLVAMLAMVQSSFEWFCLATLLSGAYASVVLSFRFAAADGVAPERQAKALSMVMAGGVVAGIIGPQLVTYTMHLPIPLWADIDFVSTFAVQAAVAAVAGVIRSGVKLPRPTADELAGGRSLGELVRQPLFLPAVVCGAMSFLVMNFLMTAAPLAMHFHGHSQADANLGIQWHVIAMYAPSFFTGHIIARFGAVKVAISGLLLILIAAFLSLSGADVFHFWGMLILLGIGWNFGFLGASSMILQCHRPEEKTRVQSLNDFIVFSLMVFGSFASGGILSFWGWDTVLWVSIGPVLLACIAMLFVSGQTRVPHG